MCHPSCPEFDGFIAGLGSSLGECELCSARVYEGDEYYIKNGMSKNDAIKAAARDRGVHKSEIYKLMI